MKCPGSVVQTGLWSVALLVRSWPVCSMYSLRVLGDLGLVSKKLNELFPQRVMCEYVHRRRALSVRTQAWAKSRLLPKSE